MMNKQEIQAIEEEMIFKFISQFLDDDPDYDLLTQDEKDKTFGIYQTILKAVYKSSFYENVYPIVYATDSASKKVVEKAINKIADIVPDVQKITVSIVN
tara:strand:- start:578 stop:874 length:297 start_codon:yes stop_codon:yes gene_type:complete